VRRQFGSFFFLSALAFAATTFLFFPLNASGSGFIRSDAAATPDCSTALVTLPTTNTPIFKALKPSSVYEGSYSDFVLSGVNFSKSWTFLLCPNGGGKPKTPASLGTLDGTDLANLKSTLTAAKGSAGIYSLRVVDGASVYDTKLSIVVNSITDTAYTPCAGPMGLAPVNINIQCSFNPLSYEVELDTFGKGVADHFIAISVTVQNKNQDDQFLLQDIRGGFPEYVVSSYDKRIPQQVGIKEEQFSARAIIFRLTSAAAGVLTGAAGFVGNDLFQEASGLFAGAGQTGLVAAIPNLSSTELTNLDSQGFSVASTVIPKAGAINLIAFLSSETLLPSPTYQAKHTSYKSTDPNVPPKKDMRNAFPTYKGNDLKVLFQQMTLQVAGIHVQQVAPSPVPTLKLFVVPFVSGVDLTAADANSTIQGTGLDVVSSVQLVSSTGATIAANLNALPPATVIDPTVAVLQIKKLAAAPAAGKYEIYFTLADGTKNDTGKSITIPVP